MISELKFYEMDELELGTVSELEEEDDEVVGEDGQVISRNAKTEEEIEAENKLKSAMERFASGVDEDSREREAQKINDSELNISDYQVEPEMEKVMTDFPLPPDQDPRAYIPYGPILPLDFYDNDDGFWDDYIKQKQERWAANPMIVRRPFLKH